ncbi:hypothetical protein [Bacteroides ilei]|uniref:hypothetical protein n=1 Tax=Bacteroides ilei TaxID=1907658 RepID=UPI000931FCAE|nr:hypothetical protein [Bacteroides ilei]
MDNRLILNVKKGNCFGFFSSNEYGLILGEVVDFNDTDVKFDNYELPVNYASIRRIEINQLNCESFGWQKSDKTLSSFIINDSSAVIFDNGQPALAYRTQSGIMQVGIRYLDELQEAFRVGLGEELPIKRD